MGINTYTALKAKLVTWLKSAAPEADTCIGLVENYLNRELRVPEMEAFTTLTSDSGSAGLPGDYLELKSLWTDTGAPLKQLPINELQLRYGAATAGPARAFAIVGTTIYFGPQPNESTDYRISYWQSIPPLGDDLDTNWLIALNGDVYFYGALALAEAVGWNDERIPLFMGWFEAAINSLKTAGVKKRYGAGPLVPQPPCGDINTRYAGYRRGGYVESALLSDSGDYLVDG